MKKNALISSILTITLCLSLIAGSTFALFTSEDKVNIAVTSGKVDVIANIEKDSLNLYSMDVKQTSNFENGGTAIFTDDDTLALNNITPGDKATFDINVTNNSTVAVQYKLAWSIDGKLSDALIATVDGEALKSGTSDWAEWNIPTTDAEKVHTLSVSVELPTSVGNNYQDESCEISFSVVAVQGNGTAEYVPMCDVVATPDTIDQILANVNEGTVIGLSKGAYDSIVMTQDNITLVSANAIVGFIDLNAHSGITIDGITFDAAKAKETYTCNRTPALSGYVANITGSATVLPAHDIVIKNCKFSGIPADEATYAPINFEEAGRTSGHAYNITVTGCEFDCPAQNYIRLNYLSSGTVNLTYNTFGSEATVTNHHAINATGNASDWYIVGNTFINWNPEKAVFGSSKQGSNINTITIKNNEFINTAIQTEFTVLNIKTSYNDSNLILNCSNNVANNGSFVIADTPVADGNDNLYKMSSTETLAERFNSIISSAQDGAVISLGSADYGKLDISGANLSNVVIEADENTNVLLNIMADSVLENVTFKGLTLEGFNGQGSYGGAINIESGADVELTFEDCSFAPNSGYSAIRSYTTSAKIKFVGCAFEGGRYAFYKSSAPIEELIFDGCSFSGQSSWVAQMNGSDTDAKVISITNCTFDGCNGGILKCLGALADGKFTFANNTITNSKGHDGKTSEWFTVDLTNLASENINISGNTRDGEPWTPTSSEGLKY